MLKFLLRGRRSRRLLSAALLLFGLQTVTQSCSLRKFFANKLDWVILFQIDSYFDVSEEQEKNLKAALQEGISWLRRERSETILKLVKKHEAEAAAKKMDEDLYARVSGEIGSLRKELEPHLLPGFTAFALSLNKKQIDHFAKKLKKSNEDLVELLEEDAEDFADEAEDKVEKRIKQLEYWYEKFTKEQRTFLEGQFRFTKPDIERQLRERQRLHEHMLKMLYADDAAGIKGFLATWFQTGEAWNDESYLSYRRGSSERWSRILRGLHKTLNDEQWKVFQGRLKEIEDDVLRFQKG